MPIKDPVQLFQTIVARMNAEDWTGAAGLCDPLSLTSFRRGMLLRFSATEPRRTVTVEDYMKSDPSMPREVAEYHVKEFEKRANTDSVLQSEFPGVASVAALRALEPVDFFAEWLYGRSPQRQMRDQAKRGAISKNAADALFARPIPEFQYESIGFLPDGDRIAHVLYRLRIQAPDFSRPDEWLATVPEEERDFVRDTTTLGHPQTFLCRKQPDGGWLGVADYAFIGGGMSVSFVQERKDDDEEDVFDAPLELSP